MKHLLIIFISAFALMTCTRQTAGTIDDVGSISGLLYTKSGTQVNYPVTVSLYRAAAEQTAALMKIQSGDRTLLKQVVTETGSYAFDSLPTDEYALEVADDDIIVAEKASVTINSETPVQTALVVNETVSIPFTVSAASDIAVTESFIDNSKVTVTGDGYALKTVQSEDITFKMVVSRNTVADTVEIRTSFDDNAVPIFEVIDGAGDIALLAPGAEITPPDTISPPDTSLVKFSGMKLITAGTFLMGPDSADYANGDPIPAFRTTTLTNNFWMDSTEVTQKQFADLMTTWYPAYGIPDWDTIGWGVGDNYPAHSVSWVDAMLYCNAKTRATGSTDTVYSYTAIIPHPDSQYVHAMIVDGLNIDLSKNGFHLPTEAQWEFACRAGTQTDYYFDADKINDYAWYQDNSDTTAHPVAQKLPNANGLYDMCGNVSEWCNDWLWAYDQTQTVDPAGPDYHPSQVRILRGGAWDNNPRLKSYDRLGCPFYTRVPPNGFRTCFTIH